MSASGKLAPLVEGGVWNVGSNSGAGWVWTVAGQRWADQTGGVLPAAPANPRFVVIGLDSTGVPNSELLDTRNVTGVTQAMTTGFTDVVGVAGVTATSTNPAWIDIGAGVVVDTPPTTGRVLVYVVALDVGAGNFICTAGAEVPPGSTGDTIPIVGRNRLGAIAAARTLKLQTLMVTTGATGAPAMHLDHAHSFPTSPNPPYPSYINVYTR